MSKKIQNGGIFIKKKKSKESIIFFIENCESIKLLSKNSMSGAIFECTLKEGVVSPYEMLRSTTVPNSHNFMSPVKKIVVKLVGIDSDVRADNDYDEWEIPEVDGFRSKRIEQEKTFEEEVNIQTQLFFKSMRLLNPWCPAPVYASVEKDKAAAIDFINKMIRGSGNGEAIAVLAAINRNIRSDRIPYLGILGMELAEGYIGLYKVYQYFFEDNPYKWEPYIRRYENMIRLRILDIALESGYFHGDYHNGNIFVNTQVSGYYAGLSGNVLIIDFGLANKIPPEKMEQIEQFYSDGNFVQALQVLYTLTRSDGVKLTKYPEKYGWLSYDYDNLDETDLPLNARQIAAENEKLRELKADEKLSDDARVAFYNDDSHSGERDKYPLLPLSNAVKNSFFEGILSGGKKKNSKKTQKKKLKKHTKRKQKRRNTRSLTT